MGVPWKNRAMEYQRKLSAKESREEEILKKLNNIEQSQQPKYTEEDLANYIANPEADPNQRVAAIKELKRMEEERIRSHVKSELSSYQQEQQDKMIRTQAYGYVQQNFPEAFKKDKAGNLVGWDNNSPLTQWIAQYLNSTPRLANDPEGIVAAAKMAYADIAKHSGVQLQQKQMKLKQENRVLKKGTLVEGSGKKSIESKTSMQKAVEKAKDGTIKSVQDVFKNIHIRQGLVKE